MSSQTASHRDWTISDDAETCDPIRWEQWADKTIRVLSGEVISTVHDRSHAIDMLRRIAEYLDCQYDGGYDGIALMPRENFTLTYDR